MTAQLPQGLIRVVSATHTEITSLNPADIIFERKQALYKFWKVHDAQSRAIQDTSNIRCRQLFWRVWGDARLSVTLSQETMMRLWMQCQQDLDLSPFQLLIYDSNLPSSFDTASSIAAQVQTRRLSKQSQRSESSASISPTQVVSPTNGSTKDMISETRSKRASSQSQGKPALSRTTSGGESSRKRSSITTATTARGKARPVMPRKRSSHSTQPTDGPRIRKSAIKSPPMMSEGADYVSSRRDSKASIVNTVTQSPESSDMLSRKISAFELPSASSWQSVDSHADPFTRSSKFEQPSASSSLLVDKNFRERFVENQKQLRSSTNLVGMDRAMRKTGSVVRFADEVDKSEDLQKLKGVVRLTPLSPRAASDGQQAKTTNSKTTWRQPLPHRDSVGSVAAISDDESDELEPELPRTKSQLSMAIADLKRSQSAGDAISMVSRGITSPQIEKEQEALISGVVTKKKTAEEEKLLAMAHKGGVTKAGGVNVPKEMLVKGSTFELGSSYDSPEEPIF